MVGPHLATLFIRRLLGGNNQTAKAIWRPRVGCRSGHHAIRTPMVVRPRPFTRCGHVWCHKIALDYNPSGFYVLAFHEGISTGRAAAGTGASPNKITVFVVDDVQIANARKSFHKLKNRFANMLANALEFQICAWRIADALGIYADALTYTLGNLDEACPGQDLARSGGWKRVDRGCGNRCSGHGWRMRGYGRW